MREPQLPHLLLFAYIHAARVKLFTQPGGVAEEDDGVEPDALRALGIRGRVVNEHALRAVQTELFKRAFKERRIGLEEMPSAERYTRSSGKCSPARNRGQYSRWRGPAFVRRYSPYPFS